MMNTIIIYDTTGQFKAQNLSIYVNNINFIFKFCLFPTRALLPFHNNLPVNLQYSPDTPALNENSVIMQPHQEIKSM